MFCPNCSCELPAVAKFCVKCGSRVEVPTARQASTLFCMNCAKPLDPSDKFCSACGQKVIYRQAEIERTTSDIEPKSRAKQANDLTETAQKTLVGEVANEKPTVSRPIPEPTSDGMVQTVSMPSSAPTQVGSTTQLLSNAQTRTENAQVVTAASVPAPYAKFVVQLLLACLSASVGVFAFFDASARNSSALGIETLSVVLALVFSWFGRATYKVILNSELKSEPGSKHRGRRALVTSLILILLYLGLAGLLGSVIGQNRAEAIQLNSDIEHQKELADRITKARNGVSDTIQSYLDMYSQIESDINEYSATLLRLRQEVPVYNSKFPAQAESMRRYANTIEKEIRRSNLLRRQIASAKHIASLDAYQQGVVWRSEMMPIFEEGDALDKSR